MKGDIISSLKVDEAITENLVLINDSFIQYDNLCCGIVTLLLTFPIRVTQDVLLRCHAIMLK